MMTTSNGVTPSKEPLIVVNQLIDVDIVNKKANEYQKKSICRCLLFHTLFTTLAITYLVGGAWIIRYLELKHIEKTQNTKFIEEDRVRQEIRGFIHYVQDMNIPSMEDYSPYVMKNKENIAAQHVSPYESMLYASTLEERIHRLIQSVIIGVKEYGLSVNDIYVPDFDPSLASAVRGRIISSNGSPVHYWQSYPDCIFFAFSLISTIGFNNLSPEGDKTRIFCLGYTLVGIPLFWLATANICYFILSLIYSIYRWFKHYLCLVFYADNYDEEMDDPGPPPILITFIIVFLAISGYICTCAALLPVWEKNLDIRSAIEFAFECVTTLGMGHIYPSTISIYNFAATMGVLWVGMMLVVLFVQVLGSVFNKIHYCGRNFVGAKSTRVWVKGHQFTVNELLRFFGREMGASEARVLKLSHELDLAFESLVREKEKGVIGRPVLSPSEPDNPGNDYLCSMLQHHAEDLNESGLRRSGDYDNMGGLMDLNVQSNNIAADDGHPSTLLRKSKIELKDPSYRHSMVCTPMMSPDGATIV